MSLVVTLLLLSVFLNTAFQLSLKRGIMALRGISLQDLRRPALILRILISPFIFVSMTLMALSMLLWLKVLSMAELSFAYPFQSLTLVLISLGSIVFLKERVTGRQWSGILLIICGVFLISRS